MEQGSRPDESWQLLEADTALRLRVFQLLDGSEVPIDQHGVRQRPEVLSGLQFG